MYSHEFVFKTIELAKSLKGAAAELLKKSETMLEKYDNYMHEICETQSCADLPGWDPGLRPHSLSDNQKLYLISKGPHQPLLVRFPQKPEIPPEKQRQFSPKWYSDYPHLEYSIEKDAAFCFVCSLFKHPNQDKSWTENGVSAWSKMKSRGTAKPGKLSGHFSSESHKAALKSFARFSDPLSHIETMLDRSARNAKIQEVADKMENKKIVKILMDVTKTLARQDIAFRGDGKEETNGNYNQIVMLVARHCPLLEKWLGSRSRKSRSHNVTYMSPESQNEMIQLLGQEVRNKILDEIKSAGMFAVSADTTPDASHKDQMTVVCRIAGVDGKPKERLLAMKVVTSKTGDATAKDVLEVINSNSLNTDELLFQSYDFASSMSGRFNGAQQKLQERLGQVVPYIPC